VTTEQASETWDRDLDHLLTTIGHHFARVEPRRRMRDYVRALLAPVARKNSWQLAEHATPDGLQHLLSRACWNPDDIRDDLQTYVAEHLGRPDGVLIIDDTGFLEKGTTSAGVQRQYSAPLMPGVSVRMRRAIAVPRSMPPAHTLPVRPYSLRWPVRRPRSRPGGHDGDGRAEGLLTCDGHVVVYVVEDRGPDEPAPVEVALGGVISGGLNLMVISSATMSRTSTATSPPASQPSTASTHGNAVRHVMSHQRSLKRSGISGVVALKLVESGRWSIDRSSSAFPGRYALRLFA
jgi:hypothetical protein